MPAAAAAVDYELSRLNESLMGNYFIYDGGNYSANASAGGGGADDEESYEEDNFEFVLYSVIVPVLFGLVSVLGLSGNALVIYLILAKERMRTVTNLLLLNLAFADLSFVLVIPP